MSTLRFTAGVGVAFSGSCGLPFVWQRVALARGETSVCMARQFMPRNSGFNKFVFQIKPPLNTPNPNGSRPSDLFGLYKTTDTPN